MSLTEPIPNYSDVLFFLVFIDVVLTLSIGLYYLWRYKKTKAINTILWGLAFLSSGIGNSLHLIIEYGFPSFFGMLGWDYYHLFQKGSVLFFTAFLGYSIFYINLINEKYSKIGKAILIGLIILATISLIIEFCFLIPIYSFSSLITRIMAFWVIFFFAYFSINSKNFRILAITIGFIIATVTGIVMATFHGTLLDIITHVIHYTFYFFIAYGLFFTRPKKE